MDFSAIFQNVLSDEEKNFQRKQEKEVARLKSSKIKLDRDGIKKGLLEVISAANSVIRKFSESIMKHKYKIFENEVNELKEISKISHEKEKCDRMVERKKEKLDRLTKEYKILLEKRR